MTCTCASALRPKHHLECPKSSQEDQPRLQVRNPRFWAQSIAAMVADVPPHQKSGRLTLILTSLYLRQPTWRLGIEVHFHFSVYHRVRSISTTQFLPTTRKIANHTAESQPHPSQLDYSSTVNLFLFYSWAPVKLHTPYPECRRILRHLRV